MITKSVHSIIEYVNQNYHSKFKFAQELENCDKESFSKLEILSDLKKMKIDTNVEHFTEYYESDNALIISYNSKRNKKNKITIFATSIELGTKLYNEIYQNCMKKEVSKVIINVSRVSMDAQGMMVLKDSIMKESDLKDIDSDYYPAIDIDAFMNEFFTRDDNILLLSGDTGTGKTKFSSLILKKAIEYYDQIDANRPELEDDGEFGKEINVAYIKNESVLSSENFWDFISYEYYDFIILDDLDYMLLPRQRAVSSSIDVERSQFISQFLSYTDGIVKNNTKFIISSNKMDDDIDDALLRPGRLFDFLKFRKLTKAEALVIWNKAGLSAELFEENFSGDEVNQSKLGSLVKMFSNNKNIKYKSYQKESTEKLKTKKKSGF